MIIVKICFNYQVFNMLTWSYTPIVVSTVDEKNTACSILHFSSSGGKLFSTSNAKPLEDASSST